MFQAPGSGFHTFLQAVVFVAVVAGTACQATAQGPSLLPPAAPPASSTPPPVNRPSEYGTGPAYIIPKSAASGIRGNGNPSNHSFPAANDQNRNSAKNTRRSVPSTALRNPASSRPGSATSRRVGPELAPIPNRQPLPPATTVPPAAVNQPVTQQPVLETLAPIPSSDQLPAPRSGYEYFTPPSQSEPVQDDGEWYVPPQNSTSINRYSATRELPADHGIMPISTIQHRLDRIIKSVLPSSMSSKQNWGGKKKITSGMKMEFSGLFLRPKRTTREVNHGSWQNLTARSKNTSKPYSVRVNGLQKRTARKATFTVTFTTDLVANAEQQEWRRGVKYRTTQASGEAEVTLRAQCTVDWVDIPGTSPPAVRLYPRVDSVKLFVDDWDGEDGSFFTNPGGSDLEDDLEQMVRNKVADANRTAKRDLNQHLAAQAMRVRFQDLVSTRWGGPLTRSVGDNRLH